MSTAENIHFLLWGSTLGGGVGKTSTFFSGEAPSVGEWAAQIQIHHAGGMDLDCYPSSLSLRGPDCKMQVVTSTGGEGERVHM